MRERILVCAMLPLAGLVACGEGPHDDAMSSTSQAVAAPGKVRTPAGEFDAACVHEIPHGAIVDLEGNVTLNGQAIAHHERCAVNQAMTAPHVTKEGLQAPTTNGWVEASWANATTISGLTYFDELDASWTVPSVPSVNNGQLIYLFPSVESNGTSILQPVLQYGNNGWFGGYYWTLASWYVTSTNAFWSTPVTVSAGDAITSYIKLADGSNSGFDFWVVSATDTTSSVSSGTAFYTPKSPFNSAQQGVLEAYNVSSCSSYPAAGDIIFTSVTATQAGPFWNSYDAVAPGWFPAYWSVSPSCSFQVSNFNFGSGGPEGTTLSF